MTFDESEIKEKLHWIVNLRWAGCVGVLGASYAVRHLDLLSFSLLPVYIVLGVVASYNIYFAYRLRQPGEDLQKNCVRQIVLDYTAVTAAVYFSGDWSSPFLYYYVFHIVIGGIILTRFTTYILAFSAIVIPLAVSALKHFRVFPDFDIFTEELMHFSAPSVGVAYLFVYSTVILMTAYFVTYLSEKLEKKREETQKYTRLSERLRSSIIMDEVIGIVKQEFLSLSGVSAIRFLQPDSSTLTLVYAGDEGDDSERKGAAIPLSEDNPFTETFFSCIPCIIRKDSQTSDSEQRYFSLLMGEAEEAVILPVWANFSNKCSEYFHCNPEAGCPAFDSEDRRCWRIPKAACRTSAVANPEDKLRSCLDCDLFTPVGIFVLDITRKSKFAPPVDLDVFIRLLDTASLAISNAKLYLRTLELSETDGLTGIKNRRAFMKMLDVELVRAQRYDKSFGLMMLDIDHFKTYNDTNGHPKGDVLLRMFSELINNHLRTTDAVGRYGGEEFIVLLPETELPETESIAERIRFEVEKKAFPEEGSQPGGRITVSIGVASFPEHGKTAEALIEAADEMLYAAKHMGRNRIAVSGKVIVS